MVVYHGRLHVTTVQDLPDRSDIVAGFGQMSRRISMKWATGKDRFGSKPDERGQTKKKPAKAARKQAKHGKRRSAKAPNND